MTVHKPHAAMKHSGVSWLGKIPAHWDVVQSRRLFSERNQQAFAGEAQLTASQKYGLLPQAKFMELEGRRIVQVHKGHDILKHVEAGDFVISMRSFQGGLEFSTYTGSVSSAYVALAPIKWVESRFFRHLFKSIAYIQALQSTSDLVRDGQALRFENFSKVALPVVPQEEQVAIADHLDRETARIDKLIARKTRFIELLRETIVAAATHIQVDKDTRWLPIKHLCEQVVRPVEQLAGETYTKLGLYNRGRGLFKKEATDTEDMGDSDFHWVNDGDLIISGQFAWEGSIAMARGEHNNCVVSHRYPILNCGKGEVLLDYLFAYFLTSHGNMVLNDCSRGSAGRNKPLNMNLLMNWKIPVPSMEAQKRIASLVVRKEKFEVLQKKSIERLQEHRTALITAAVTGKIDLRENA
jgi:type I restriction enzyme, S subunit